MAERQVQAPSVRGSTRSVHDCPLCRALLELATSAAENRAEVERRRATIAVVNRQGDAA